MKYALLNFMDGEGCRNHPQYQTKKYFFHDLDLAIHLSGAEKSVEWLWGYLVGDLENR